jgi:hypothetical protein
MQKTKAYEEYLLGCRFCPMCKPASDSLNATFLESHSTRAHAMIIWRVMNGIKDYSDKEVELLYRSNLDGVSEAFCVDHYPVSGFMLAAREDIVNAGKEPASVAAVLAREQVIKADPKREMVLFAEGVDLDAEWAWLKAKELAGKINAGVVAGFNGYLPYVLGGREKAIQEARELAEAIIKTGVKTLVVPGPESYYTFTKLYEELGIELPVKVVPLMKLLFANRKAEGVEGKKVFFHDVRVAYNLSASQPDEKVILPDFFGPEELLGTGEVYEFPREVLKKSGAELVFLVWSRGLANAMGNDEGVAVTYPDLAKKMTKRRLQQISQTGAELLVTDSLATVIYLESFCPDLVDGLTLKYLGDL